MIPDPDLYSHPFGNAAIPDSGLITNETITHLQTALLNNPTWTPQEYSGRLPGSIKDLQVASRPLDLNAAIGNVFAVFLVLKLMRLGHPASRPYYEELCGEGILGSAINDCQQTLFEALQRYD